DGHVQCFFTPTTRRNEQGGNMELNRLGQAAVLRSAAGDVAVARERTRRARLRKLAVVLAPLAAWAVTRAVTGRPIAVGAPHLPFPPDFLHGFVLVVLLGGVFSVTLLGAGRSHPVLYRPSEIVLSLAQASDTPAAIVDVDVLL